MSEERWVAPLTELFDSNRGTLHLIGVGNPLRKDDGVGIQIIMNLGRKCGSAPVKSCEIHAPSARVESLITGIDYSKDKTLLLDSVEFNSAPGSIIFTSFRNSRFGFFSTHNVPIRTLPNVSSNLDSIFLLGIQPLNIEVGEGLSSTVRNSMDKIVRALLDLMR